MGPHVEGHGPAKQGGVIQLRKTGKDPIKPLRHRSFYLDLKEYKGIQALKEDIVLLGGVLENFISKEVSCVVTNKSINKAETNGHSFTNQNIQSPIFSPATDSPSTSDTPAEERKKIVMSRGNKMLEKAIRMVNGTGDVLQIAQKWGVQVVPLPRFLSWLENYKTKNNIKKIKNDKKKRTESQLDKSVIHLMEPFLKFEAVSRQYRPVYKQFRKWPELIFDPNSYSSPFNHNIQTTNNRRQTTSRRSVRSEHELNRSQQSKIGKVGIRDRKQLGFKRKHGYCEICSIPYTNLYKHLETSQHQKFVSDEKNYTSLDKVISSGNELSDYLESLKSNESADEVKLLTPVVTRLVSAETDESPATTPSPQTNQLCHRSFTPEQPMLQTENSLSHEENGGKFYVEVSRDCSLSSNRHVAGDSWNCGDISPLNTDDASKSLATVANTSLAADDRHEAANLLNLTDNQNSTGECIYEDKVVENSNSLNETHQDVKFEAPMQNQPIKRDEEMHNLAASDIGVLAVDAPASELNNISKQDAELRPSASIVHYHSSNEDVAHIPNVGTQNSKSCKGQDENCSTVESEERKVEVNNLVSKTLRSTVLKRNSFLNQHDNRKPLDLSINKLQHLEENGPFSQKCKMLKPDTSYVENSFVATASLPCSSAIGVTNEGVESVANNCYSSNVMLNLTCDNLNASVSSVHQSNSKSETHASNNLANSSGKSDQGNSAKVKCVSDRKTRTVQVLTDHSMRVLFHSDSESSEFLGFGSENCQDLPLDLSYTEIQESSVLSSSVLGSEKECNVRSTSEGSASEGIPNNESECSVESENDDLKFGETNQQLTSESSEEWDQGVNTFLEKHVSNTVIVK